MHRLALVGYLAFALVAVSLVNRIGAQTQPIAGLSATTINAGASGPPSQFPDGSGSAPSITFSSQPTLGLWKDAANTIGMGGSGVASAVRIKVSAGTLLTVGTAGVDGIWTITSGGALQNVSSGQGTIVMATTTIFNASGTLQNNACNFNDLNILLTTNGQQCYCGTCNIATPCTNGGTGALAIRQAGANNCK